MRASGRTRRSPFTRGLSLALCALIGLTSFPAIPAAQHNPYANGPNPRHRLPGDQFIWAHQLAQSIYHEVGIAMARPDYTEKQPFPKSLPKFREVQKLDPTSTAPLEPCVDLMVQAGEIMRPTAPLMKRPAWDHGGARRISEAARQAKPLMAQARSCLESARAPDVFSSNGRPPRDDRTRPPGDEYATNGDPGSPPGRGPGGRGGTGVGVPAPNRPPLRGAVATTAYCPNGVAIPRENVDVLSAYERGPYICRHEMTSGMMMCCPTGHWPPNLGPIPTDEQVRNRRTPGYNPCLNPRPPPECREPLARRPDQIEIPIPKGFDIFVPGLQNLADIVNFLSTYHPVETAYVGIAIAGGRVAAMGIPANQVAVEQALGGARYKGPLNSVNPRDATVSKVAPPVRTLDRPVSRSATQNQRVQDDIVKLKQMGANDFRVNQQQVTGTGTRVGINRPDLQFTYRGQRYYVEYDTPISGRGVLHGARLGANDPDGIILLITAP